MKFSDLFFEVFIPVALLFLVVAVTYMILIVEPRSQERKNTLYSECLETDYNKFECYSMIYGDK